MNKISLLASIIVISLLASLSSCIEPEYDIVGCGDIVEKRIYVPEFNAIATSSSADIVVTKGESLQVILSDYENLVDFWELRVENNILFIRTDPFSALVNSKAKLRIVLPGELYEAKVSGSGNIVLGSAFNSLERVAIYGNGYVKSSVAASYNKLYLNVTGSGYIDLGGSAGQIDAVSSGSGKMYLSGLVARTAICTISGSGNMYVHAEDTLLALIAGSGDIIYSGNPVLDVQMSGSGRVRHE